MCLTLACKVIRYRLVQVLQNLKIKRTKKQLVRESTLEITSGINLSSRCWKIGLRMTVDHRRKSCDRPSIIHSEEKVNKQRNDRVIERTFNLQRRCCC